MRSTITALQVSDMSPDSFPRHLEFTIASKAKPVDLRLRRPSAKMSICGSYNGAFSFSNRRP